MSSALPPSVAKSPLFKLPPELRNQVYEYAALVGPWWTRNAEFSYVSDARWTIHRAHYGIRERALLATCRIIRLEAMAKFNELPSYLITVKTTFDHHPDRRFWADRVNDLFSRYTIESRDIKTEHAEGRRLWDAMTKWLHNVQELYVGGQKEAPGGRSWWYGASGGSFRDGFEYRIQEVCPRDYVPIFGWLWITLPTT